MIEKNIAAGHAIAERPASERVYGRGPGALLVHPAARQFVKFCIVGASSTVVTFGIYYLLIYQMHLDVQLPLWLSGAPVLQSMVVRWGLYRQVAALIGWLFGVTNGFFWNSRWTFPQDDPTQRRAQYLKFVAVNIVGLVLNQTILFFVVQILKRGQDIGAKGPEDIIGLAIATVIVVFWNFTANKIWTFKS